MKNRKTIWAWWWGLATVLFGPLAFAQNPPDEFPIVANYNVQSTSYIYPLFDPLRDGSGLGNIKTTGSSTTVDAATGTPFSVSTVGDEISVLVNSIPQVRYITAVGSSTQITVNSAVNLSANGTTGYQWNYRSLKAGTGAGNGWFDVSLMESGNIAFGVETINATDLKVRIECAAYGAQANPIQIYPPPTGTGQCAVGTFTVAGITARCGVVFNERWQRCRFGVLANTPTSTNNVSAYFIGRKRRTQ